MDSADWNESFLKANANRQFIAHEMADVLRNLMRAVSSDNDTGHKAGEGMNFVGKLLQHCDEPLSWWHIFSDAIEIIRSNAPNESYESDYFHVAERGIKYFVESTASDNAARGRASKRRGELQDSIRWLEEAKAKSQAEWQVERRLALNAEKLGKRK